MINNSCLSSLQDINFSQMSHYRNLHRIVCKPHNNISMLKNPVIKIAFRKKMNHERWKKFQQKEYNGWLSNVNNQNESRILKIRLSESRYKTRESVLSELSQDFNPFRESSYSINRRHQLKSIERQNPEVANRIINVKGELEAKRMRSDFKKKQVIGKRLEKFPIMQRMTELSYRKIRRWKTEDPYLHNSREPTSPIGSKSPKFSVKLSISK